MNKYCICFFFEVRLKMHPSRFRFLLSGLLDVSQGFFGKKTCPACTGIIRAELILKLTCPVQAK